MANWKKITIVTDENEICEAQAPVIISASRSTDIPAFYANWFIDRLNKGYIEWKNPFNGIPIYVSFKKTRVVVFWTKNPKPMMKHLDFLDKIIENYYFQYTLNDYEKEGFERKVPSLDDRIKTFIELSEKIGKKRVIWRFDPLILTSEIDVKILLKKIEYIGDQIKDHTNKLVFSFADISIYKKVENNLRKEGVSFIEFSPQTMREFASGLQQLNKKWGFDIGTCAEKISLERYNIKHNKCIDDDLMIDLFSEDKVLMKFLGVKFTEPDLFNNSATIIKKTQNLRDRGQRNACGCIASKDIGQYNTCPHECVYCYANTSRKTAKENYNRHLKNSHSASICPKGDF